MAAVKRKVIRMMLELDRNNEAAVSRIKFTTMLLYEWEQFYEARRTKTNQDPAVPSCHGDALATPI